MTKTCWLIAGNKGNVGKSVVAKGLVGWLKSNSVAVTVADGDKRTPDVFSAFVGGSAPSFQFDLTDDVGWAEISDFLCDENLVGDVVVNLPDAISDKAITYFNKLSGLANGYDLVIKVLFVMNTLPDGLNMLGKLRSSFKSVIPVKNLFHGFSRDFQHFDNSFGKEFDGRIILFPALKASLMIVVREANLTFEEFIKQNSDLPSNFSYAKIAVADWRDSMFESLADVLEGE